MRWSALLACLAAALLASCGSSSAGGQHSETISETSFDGTWPFKVSSGTLRCVPGDERVPLGAVLFKVGDTNYAVNGAALNAGYPKPSPIRDRGHSRLGDVILEGTYLCPELGP
jgi:hypothetical protein